MTIALWIIAAIVALAMLAAGASKLTGRRDTLIASGNFAWAEDFSQAQITSLGVLEVLGGIGLLLPAALGIATVLTPLAATGVAILMIGAVVTHVRRGERALIPPPLILATLAALVAILRFGPYSF